jgi:2-polyprenyl-6-methoxyphenol hydroxylase-like FAD-dependent oxidoreductase
MGRDIRVGNVAWGYAPRRRRLDQVLVEAAIEAGVEFRPSFLVEDCLWRGDGVEGIRGRDLRTRTSSAEKALITIGADGRNSTVARTVNAPCYEETPALTCWYFSYWSGVPTGGFEWYLRKDRVIFAFSTNDNLFAIFIGWPIDKFSSVKADIEGEFMSVVDRISRIPGASALWTPRRAVLWRRRPAELFAASIRTGLGAGRRRWLPQRPYDGARNLRCFS